MVDPIEWPLFMAYAIPPLVMFFGALGFIEVAYRSISRASVGPEHD